MYAADVRRSDKTITEEPIMKTNRKIPSVTSILDKIEVLMIILAIAGIIYFTHSLFALIIGIAGLILFRYVNLFSQTSENDMRTGYEKNPEKSKQ